MKKEELQKELASIAPLLAQQKRKSTSFKVPENYFEQLEQQVMEQVKAAPSAKTTTKVRTLPLWVARVAALFLLVGGGVWLWQSSSNTSDLLADISPTEINQYITDNLHEFEEDLLFNKNNLSNGWLNQEFSKKEINIYLEEYIEELEAEDLEYLL